MAEEKDYFVIDDLKKATWAMRKIRDAEKEYEKVMEVAEAERDRIVEWADKETADVRSTIDYMRGLLVDYYQRERAENPKFKLSTPYGKVSSRKRQPKLSMDDEKVLAYLEENELSDLIKVQKKYSKNDVKKLIDVVEKDGEPVVIDKNGTLLDFVKAENQEDSYTVKTEKGR